MSNPDTIPLPTELYPWVLEHISSLDTLAKVCLIDRAFLFLGRRKLYEKCWIRPWEKRFDPKFKLLFRTLSESKEIARLVKQLDVRCYPMATGSAGSELEDVCVQALENVTELEGLTWTRDTTLTSRMISALTTSPPSQPRKPLKRLEINGHLTYPASSLMAFTNGLEDLKIILPNKDMCEILVDLCRAAWERNIPEDGSVGQGLRALEIGTQDSRLLNDQLFMDLAPFMGNLRSFRLWGCGHTGPKGYFRILKESMGSLEDLSLEGCGRGDDEDFLDEHLYLERESPLTTDVHLKSLKVLSLSESTFSRLLLADRSRQRDNTSLRTLTYPSGGPTAVFVAHPKLDHTSFFNPHLESLHVSRRGSGDARATHIIHAASQMWPGLKKLWFTDYMLTDENLGTIVEKMPRLDTLMVRMYEARRNPKHLAMYLSKLSNLRVFHLQAAERRPGTDDYTPEDLRFIASMCGPRLEQIGWANRVYSVKRKKVFDRVLEGACSPKPKGWGTIGGMSVATSRDGTRTPEMMPTVLEKEEVYVEEFSRPGVIPEAFSVWRG